MIMGIEAYRAFLNLNDDQKTTYLMSNFPFWYCFIYETRETIFDPKAFVTWYDKTNFIEKDLWFRALNTEQQKSVLKIWADKLNRNACLHQFQHQSRPTSNHDGSSEPPSNQNEQSKNLRFVTSGF